MGGWKAAGIGLGTSLLVAGVAVWYAVVIWNPLLVPGEKSGAARECAYDPAHPPDWGAMVMDGKVDSAEFYAEYHSHLLPHLATVRTRLQEDANCPRLVYFVGDSTLDNKHWLFPEGRAKLSLMRRQARLQCATQPVNGWEHAVSGRMVKDVAYWMNAGAEERLGTAQLCTIMTSIEESTVDDREQAPGGLLAQDAFVRDHVTERDFVVVSVGGNDLALRPRLRTVVNMAMLVRSPDWMIKCGCAPGFAYFRDLFSTRIVNIVKRVTSKRQPRMVLLCFLYYLDEHVGGSWADFTLEKLGYNSNPAKLQLIMRSLYAAIAAKGFDVPGVEVTPVPMFEVLDGKTHADYKHRVEPSIQGGRKMAKQFLDIIAPVVQQETARGGGAAGAGAGAGSGVGSGTDTAASGHPRRRLIPENHQRNRYGADDSEL